MKKKCILLLMSPQKNQDNVKKSFMSSFTSDTKARIECPFQLLIFSVSVMNTDRPINDHILARIKRFIFISQMTLPFPCHQNQRRIVDNIRQFESRDIDCPLHVSYYGKLNPCRPHGRKLGLHSLHHDML